jgi:hypothetical protein
VVEAADASDFYFAQNLLNFGNIPDLGSGEHTHSMQRGCWLPTKPCTAHRRNGSAAMMSMWT